MDLKSRIRGIVALAAAAGCSACAMGGTPDGVPGLSQPNVLLIVVDTLRADHLGVYGYERPTSPSIDAFASGAIRFARAHSTAPWTMPSVASMITGRYPSAHGLMGTFRKLPADAVTLAEALSGAGYYTAGVISHRLLGKRYGFDRGYAHYSQREVQGHLHLSTDGVAEQAVDILQQLAEPDGEAAAKPPFFLFLHFFDPHFPYRPHPEYGLAPAAAGRLDGDETIFDLLDMSGDMTAEEIEFVVGLYDGEIRYTDEGIGRVLAALTDFGFEEDTVVVLVGDHGEEFLERGWIGHTVSLHQELVHVPLLLKVPGIAPAVVDRPVSLVSLAPTVLELVGLDLSLPGTDGVSLLALARSPEAPYGTPVFSEVAYRQQEAMRATQQALVAYPHKLIRNLETGELMLFDLAQDPGERWNVSSSEPERTSDLLAQMVGVRAAAMAAALEAGAELELPADELEALRALGYIR